MSPFQDKILETLKSLPNQHETTTMLAHRLKSNRLAVASACRALERQGILCQFCTDDSQWARQKWAIRSTNHD